MKQQQIGNDRVAEYGWRELMDDRIRRIVGDGRVVAGVLLASTEKGFAGSILNDAQRCIFAKSGLTYWTAATVEEVLVKLELWAEEARARGNRGIWEE